MNQSLHQVQKAAGASFSTDSIVPLSFANDTEAIRAAKESVALCDRSNWGLLLVSDDDRASFIHNQTSNDIKTLQPGQGCDTVFLTSTARTLDLATVFATEDALLVLVSPGKVQSLMAWLDRYLFPMDRVQLTDISPKYAIFSLIGANSRDLLGAIGIELPETQPDNHHALVPFQDTEIRVVTGSGLDLPGYTLVVPADAAAGVWSQLQAAGATPIGEAAWERLRVERGRPACDRELTEEYNPLEAGLWYCTSFTKGCYIGQETIARLNTYQGVKQRLWGIKLQSPVACGSDIVVDGKKVGTLTSVSETENEPFGLGYVRVKAGGEGLKVGVGETEGELVAVPFLSHAYV
ncbi:folate-binding protein YgfZ [Oscillatoria sp. FACHB-1406]|uniref:CAF17-like 4Fe-4S cluster assembly/insertion protein YgfZ n=1 Tax=Oscillatoria sp. FACHB-1406 TaxID=2692846 RepID=UPI0016890672|nr:folate-binding protein YgfZ [Oscillatoria sp. FACHB-1406]MBD2580527.1 folate-binding protein YgfZ [Oscillatoria sp. FACHB-1406]